MLTLLLLLPLAALLAFPLLRRLRAPGPGALPPGLWRPLLVFTALAWPHPDFEELRTRPVSPQLVLEVPFSGLDASACRWWVSPALITLLSWRKAP